MLEPRDAAGVTITDELGRAIAKAMRAWACQQDVLGKVAADERPLHVQLGRPPAIVFRVTGAEARTVYQCPRTYFRGPVDF
jgi:hypothetical protein